MLTALAICLVGQGSSVRSFGAVGDGRTLDTKAIQTAIDSVSAKGGGEILFDAGRYVCGTLHLRSHVAIHLMAGATLVESPDLKDFDSYEPLPYNPESDRETSDFAVALLAGKDVEDVTVFGEGGIDGNRSERGNRADKPGPKPIALKRCRNVAIQGIHVNNAPNYAVSLLGCSKVRVDGVTVKNGYSDGIDPDSCDDVRISNCDIDCYDDAICPKASFALGVNRVCENIVVTNCVLRGASNQFKLGTESQGGFRNIAVDNCVFAPRPPGLKVAKRDKGGITLTLVDGGTMERVTVSNIVLQDQYSSIFIRLGDSGRHRIGAIRHISISHVAGAGIQVPVIIAGIPGHPVEDVTLDGLDLSIKGGVMNPGKLRRENPAKGYPESNMFDDPPSQALYLTWTKNVTLRNSRFAAEAPDKRPLITADNVSGLSLTDLNFMSASPTVIWACKLSDLRSHDLRYYTKMPIQWLGPPGKNVHLSPSSGAL